MMTPAWWGFTSAADKQYFEASVHIDNPRQSQLAADMDDNLLANIPNNPY